MSKWRKFLMGTFILASSGTMPWVILGEPWWMSLVFAGCLIGIGISGWPVWKMFIIISKNK